MFEWLLIRLRGLWHYARTAYRVTTAPRQFAESIVLNDKTNYYRALTFFATGLGLGVAVEVLFSYFFKTHLDEILYQLVFVAGWIANGLFIYLFLRLLRVRNLTVGNVYHCYSYTIGAGFFLATALSAVIVGFQFSQNLAQVRASACEPRLVECILKEMGLLQNTQTTISALVAILGIYFAWVFAVLISRTVGTPKWRPFVALFLGGISGQIALSYLAAIVIQDI